jgi:serine/threonine-protein kinase
VGQDVSDLPAGLRPGDIVAGKYRIDGVIGAGAMGIVVVACHLLLDEKVAIKFLLPQAVGSSDAVGRFLREAQAAVRIKSEHIARVFDVATLDDGTPYIVMEYLEGSDLAAILQQRGLLPVEQAVEFVLQACEAIAEAHELGIVHRDLKPANLFVVRRADGLYSVKVLDFGISKTLGVDANAPSIAITDTMVVMGSPAYMSPEQMESARKVGPQTDVWALGAILCELVTGRIPFDGQSLPEVYTKIVSQPPPSLREWAPGLPVGLEDVILKCLKTNRTLRYRDVGDLAAAVQEFGPRRASASVDRITRTVEAAKKGANADPFTGAPWSPRSGDASPTIAEKTLCSWGDPVPATLPPPGRTSTRTRLAIGAAAAVGLAAVVGVVASRPRLHAIDPAVAVTPAHASPAPSLSALQGPSIPLDAPTPAIAIAPEASNAVTGVREPPATKPRATARPQPRPQPPTPPASSSGTRSPSDPPSEAQSALSPPQPPPSSSVPPSDLRALDLSDPK